MSYLKIIKGSFFLAPILALNYWSKHAEGTADIYVKAGLTFHLITSSLLLIFTYLFLDFLFNRYVSKKKTNQIMTTSVSAIGSVLITWSLVLMIGIYELSTLKSNYSKWSTGILDSLRLIEKTSPKELTKIKKKLIISSKASKAYRDVDIIDFTNKTKDQAQKVFTCLEACQGNRSQNLKNE